MKNIFGSMIILFFLFFHNSYAYMDEEVKLLAETLNIEIPDVKFQKEDFDAYYENAQKLFEEGDYTQAKNQAELYLDMTFPKSCKGYDLYAKILQKSGSSLYIQYERLYTACELLIQVDNPERNEYFDNKVSGDKRIDTWKMYFHELMFYEQAELGQKAGDGVLEPKYTVRYNDYIPYIYAVLLANSRDSNDSLNYNFYKKLIEDDYYYKSYSLLVLYNLYAEKLTKNQKEELLYGMLKYDNEICKNDCGSMKGVTDVAFKLLAQMNTDDPEKALFFRILSYKMVLQENLSTLEQKQQSLKDIINGVKALLEAETGNILPFTPYISQYISSEFSGILESAETYYVGIDTNENVNVKDDEFQYISLTGGYMVKYKSEETSNQTDIDANQEGEQIQVEDSEGDISSQSAGDNQEKDKKNTDVNPFLIFMSLGVFFLIICFIVFLFMRK